LIDKLNELVNLLSHGRGLTNIAHLAKEKFMMIAIESLMNIEPSPVRIFEKMFYGLEPTPRGPFELHYRTTYPHTWINEMHFKVGLGLSDPKLGIFAVEMWKVKLRNLAY
jgi:hypothetical protein